MKLSILEEQLREKGKEIVNQAENIANFKKTKIRSSLLSLWKIFLFSIFWLSLLILGAGIWLYRMVAQPLHIFEEYIKK